MDNWYNHAIIYQIYPKSFQDSNGDGIGDLPGIIQRIPYLKTLGINTVWLNPVFTSPQVDNGYDVANYYAIDPDVGTMADMDALIKALHDAGIHLLLDFVMNHTSDQHPWFQDAIKHPGSLYRDYYIFAGDHDQRPNNWGSFFGGSVWAKDPAGTGKSYFHLFDRHMPDLNWANPEVRHAMGDIADFWLKKGIDGLRVDAFIHIAKARLDQDFPTADGSREPVVAEPFFANLPQVQTWLRPFTERIKTDYPQAFLLGEAASADVNLAAAYTDRLMDSVVTFRYFKEDESQVDPAYPAQYQPKPLNWQAFKQTQAVWQQTLSAMPTLYWSNHDMPRLLGRVAKNSLTARSLAMLMYLQRGIPIIYYGEELGMTNLQFDSIDAFQDQTVGPWVQAAMAAGQTKAQALQQVSATHKLPARGGMRWDNTQNAGFSTGTPWLQGKSADTPTVEKQADDPESQLNFYRELLKLKQTDLFSDGDYRLLTTDANSYVYQRQFQNQKAIVAVSIGDASVIDLPRARYDIRLENGTVQLLNQQLRLSAGASVALITEE